MTQQGRTPGRKYDPEAMLNAAMDQTIADLSNAGKGLEADDVVTDQPSRQPRPRADRPERTTRPEPRQEREQQRAPLRRDSQGRFQPVQADDDDDDIDMADVLVDEEPEPEPRRTPTRQSRRAAAVDEDDDEDDDEELDDEDDDDEDLDDLDDDDIPSRDLEDADEVEAEDDGLGPEGDDEELDDEDDRPAKRKGKGRSKLSPKLQRLIAKEAEKRAEKVTAERDALRDADEKRQQALRANAQFFVEVLGTNEQLDQLKATALNRQLPQQQRDRAAAALSAFESNRQFAGKYQSGIIAAFEEQQAKADREAMTQFAQLQALDPKIVAQGNRAKTLVHAYRVGMDAAEKKLEKKYRRQIAELERRLQTRAGSRSERRVRDGTGRRPTLASANGRRANGRTARPDPMRGVLSMQRGIGAGSSVPMPTDAVMDAIKRGDMTLADLRLAQR